jgi:ribosome-associated translation inhibitor RaiA
LALIGKHATGGQINNLFLLANKTDLSDNNNNPERIVQKITERMEKYFKGRYQARKIYPISCKTGLNLEQFTADLNHFLQADKDIFFLEDTSKKVERAIDKLLQNLDKQLKKRDESLQDITYKIEAFKQDKEENQESIAKHLKNYELIYYKSKQVIGKTLNETFDCRLPNFKDDLQHYLENAGSDNKKNIITNVIDQFIKDVVQRSIPIIVIKIQKEFLKIKSEVAIKHRVFENVSFYDSFTIGSRYDGLISKMEKEINSIIAVLFQILFWGYTAGIMSMYLGGVSLVSIAELITTIPVAMISLLIPLVYYVSKTEKSIPNLVDETANNLKNSFKNTWQDDKKNQQNPLCVSIKNTLDMKFQEDIKNIGKAHREICNQFLQSIEEKLQAQYNEKQKSETELQMLQCNHGLISEELKFLKNEQAYLQNQLQKLYVNLV